MVGKFPQQVLAELYSLPKRRQGYFLRTLSPELHRDPVLSLYRSLLRQVRKFGSPVLYANICEEFHKKRTELSIERITKDLERANNALGTLSQAVNGDQNACSIVERKINWLSKQYKWWLWKSYKWYQINFIESSENEEPHVPLKPTPFTHDLQWTNSGLVVFRPKSRKFSPNFSDAIYRHESTLQRKIQQYKNLNDLEETIQIEEKFLKSLGVDEDYTTPIQECKVELGRYFTQFSIRSQNYLVDWYTQVYAQKKKELAELEKTIKTRHEQGNDVPLMEKRRLLELRTGLSILGPQLENHKVKPRSLVSSIEKESLRRLREGIVGVAEHSS